MTSFRKAQQYYREDLLKDIISPPKNKKNKNENSDDNFWYIDPKDEEDIFFNLNLSIYDKSNENINFNINNIVKSNNKKEKEKQKAFYERLSKPKKEKINYNFDITKKNKTIQSDRKKKIMSQSVETKSIEPNEKIKTIKVDDLSVFKRNQKWLKIRQDNINKAIEKKINKKEKELKEYKQYKSYKKPSELKRYQIFNEEKSVKNRPENINYFIRLNKMREEKGKTPLNTLSHKINLLNYSHYSGTLSGHISTREMNKCIKFIHNKLKG